jgi:hypothetical protein
MSTDPHASVVLITSADEHNRTIGTGFVIHTTPDAAYVITCAHVVRDVGGAEHVRIRNLPVEIVVTSSERDADMAVLRVPELTMHPALTWAAAGSEGAAIALTGYSDYDQRHMVQTLKGVLGARVSFQLQQPPHSQIPAWRLQLTDDYPILPGYSGSPVVDAATGHVLAVVSHREGGNRGLAISLAVLPDIWPNCPPPHEQGAESPMPMPASEQVELYTYSPDGSGPNVALRYDWSEDFAPLPDESFWNDILLPTFEDLRRDLGQRTPKVKRVDLFAQARLSAVLAFGYAFKQPARVELCVNQFDATWCSGAPAASEVGITTKPQLTGPRAAQQLTLELCISRDISSGVQAYLKEAGLTVWKRVQIKPDGADPARTWVRDASHAVAVAHDVEQELLRLRDEAPGATIHLFLAVPQALAAMIGLRLNKCGPIQCYEFEAGTYSPSCLLR